MRNLIVGIVFALITVSAHSASVVEVCSSISSAAETTMRARQAGVPMERMMDGVEEELMVQMVLAAYEQPRYPEHQRELVSEIFRDEWYLSCFQASRRASAKSSTE
mgnify:CR=1 FL=1